ncbi:MAG: SRPBCC domain-containing protein [Polyangiaceae bacterium]|nr:SRPBCC domain-containing protein [Polyangiaceae bacterium]
MTPKDSLSLDFDLPHPPDKVWRALSDPALLSQWLMPVLDWRPEVGAAFRFQTPGAPGWDGVVSCRVLELEAERRLTCTWSARDLDTVVSFTLTPTDAGTRLSIVHSGFLPHHQREAGGARHGWTKMGHQLIALLHTLSPARTATTEREH